jgi:hypothetical protein
VKVSAILNSMAQYSTDPPVGLRVSIPFCKRRPAGARRAQDQCGGSRNRPAHINDYAAGKAPQAIVKQLNKEAVPGPSGTAWGPSTIHGNPDRGTGILNNELYIGKLVWNRLRYIKDPETGKRVSRPNPESEWIRHSDDRSQTVH